MPTPKLPPDAVMALMMAHAALAMAAGHMPHGPGRYAVHALGQAAVLLAEGHPREAADRLAALVRETGG